MTLTVIVPVVLCIAVFSLLWFYTQRIGQLHTRLNALEGVMEKFRQLLSEMRGEEEVERILCKVRARREEREQIDPVRYDFTTIAQLKEHMELFSRGTTCLFAGDDGLKNPSLYIIRFKNRLGDTDATRDVVHIRFRPAKPEQMRSVVTKHLPETAVKLYVGKQMLQTAGRELDFVMPAIESVDAYDDVSCKALLSQLEIG